MDEHRGRSKRKRSVGMNDHYQEGEYFEHNDKIILLIGEDVYGIDPKASARQISLGVRALVEEARSKKAGGQEDKPAQ